GSRAPAELALSSSTLQSGEGLRCPDTENDARVRPDLCRPLGIRGLIAVPIVFEGKIYGVLELHFARPNTLQDQDLRVGQLLASLLGEAVGKEREAAAAPVEVEEEPIEDNAAMLAALEKIKPQLQRLAGAAHSVSHTPLSAEPSQTLCESCGHALG